MNARVPLKFGPLGQAVASGHLKVIRGEGNQPVSAPGFEWLRDEGILECGISKERFWEPLLGSWGLCGGSREFEPSDRWQTEPQVGRWARWGRLRGRGIRGLVRTVRMALKGRS